MFVNYMLALDCAALPRLPSRPPSRRTLTHTPFRRFTLSDHAGALCAPFWVARGQDPAVRANPSCGVPPADPRQVVQKKAPRGSTGGAVANLGSLGRDRRGKFTICIANRPRLPKGRHRKRQNLFSTGRSPGKQRGRSSDTPARASDLSVWLMGGPDGPDPTSLRQITENCAARNCTKRQAIRATRLRRYQR